LLELLEALLALIDEVDLAASTRAAIETTLVDEMVVKAAQQHEVVETGLTAVGPVPDVVAVAELVAGTAREAAAAVPGLQGAPHSRRNGPRAPPDVQRLAIGVFFNGAGAAVAANTP